MHWLVRVTIFWLGLLPVHEPVAQTERAVVFTSNTHTLAGTLTLPAENGRHPGVVIVLGSGAQNRDGETEGVKPFKQLAAELARTGFVVLRYDNRSTGSSGGKPPDESTTPELATDARAAVHFLARQPTVDANRIGLIGHSEGATMATIAATQEPVISFLLLINGTCLPGREDILLTTRQRLHQAGLSADAVNSYVKNLNVLLANPASTPLYIRRGAARQLILAEVNQLPSDQRARIKEKDIASSVEAQLREASSRWQQQYLVLNPALYYPKVRCPVSLFFSQSDIEGVLVQKRRMFADILRQGNQFYSIQTVSRTDHNLLRTDSKNKTQSGGVVSTEFINRLSLEAGKYMAKQQTPNAKQPKPIKR